MYTKSRFFRDFRKNIKTEQFGRRTCRLMIAARQTSLVFANANPSYVEQILRIFHVEKLIFPRFFAKILKIEQFGCLDK